MLFVIAILAVVPQGNVAYDQVDVVEINHYYDSKGHLVFDQVVYYDFDFATARHQTRDWRLKKSEWQVPQKNWRTGKHVARWLDNGTRRTVEANEVRETWTNFDPEIVERDYVPREKRIGLSGGMKLGGDE